VNGAITNCDGGCTNVVAAYICIVKSSSRILRISLESEKVDGRYAAAFQQRHKTLLEGDDNFCRGSALSS
jgi:hypothetical protein